MSLCALLVSVVPFVGCSFVMIGSVLCVRFLFFVVIHAFVVPIVLLFAMLALVAYARAFI